MNQISCQKANSSVEKDFYKLMNNSNFGCDCRNNIDNCTAPIADKLDETSYLKKYQSPLDTTISKFVSCTLIEQEMEASFNNSIMKLNIDDEYFDAKKNSLETKRVKELDSINLMKQKIQKSKKDLN